MKKHWMAASAAALLLWACSDMNNESTPTSTDTNAGGRDTTAIDTSSMQPDTTMIDAAQFSIVIDTSDKQLMVVRGGDTVNKYPIAVGRAKYPTPVGQFRIHQIDFNPDWTPPEGDWAKDKKYEKPGSKNNPMGRARIVYQSPYSIHGTKDLNSLGESESHGSVRMANAQVLELARIILQAAGNEQPESWYQRVLSDSTKMETVTLKRDVPLVNRQ